jgi:hypothetical protein
VKRAAAPSPIVEGTHPPHPGRLGGGVVGPLHAPDGATAEPARWAGLASGGWPNR